MSDYGYYGSLCASVGAYGSIWKFMGVWININSGWVYLCMVYTVKPLLSYFLLSYVVAAGWLMVSREGVSGTRQWLTLARSGL